MTTQQNGDRRCGACLARTNAALTVALAVALVVLAAGGMPSKQCRYAPALPQSADEPAQGGAVRLSVPTPYRD